MNGGRQTMKRHNFLIIIAACLLYCGPAFAETKTIRGDLAITGLAASLPVFTNGSKTLETKTKAQAQAAFGFYAGTGVFNGPTGVSVSIGATLAGTTYRVMITPTADPLNIGSIYVSNKTTNTFTIKCTGSDTSCTFDWILIDMN
jgi:hypothetical protein